MVSEASPGSAEPKMNELFIHMAHACSDCAWAEVTDLKPPLGQILVFDWFWVRWMPNAIARWKQVKKYTPMMAVTSTPRHL